MEIDKLKLLTYVATAMADETEEEAQLLEFMSPDPNVVSFVERSLTLLKVLYQYSQEEE